MDMMDTLDMIDIGSFGLDTGLQIALTIMGVLIGIVAFVSTIVSVWLMIQYSQFNRKENSAGIYQPCSTTSKLLQVQTHK